MIRDNVLIGVSSIFRGMDGNLVSFIDFDDIDFFKDVD